MIYSLTVTNSIGESLTFELSKPWASGYAIKSINGVGTPYLNVNTTPYGIGDGSVLGSIKAEYRLITINLYPLKSPTVETARQRLYRYFQIKKNIVLTFNTENRLVTIDGYVENIEPDIFTNPEGISIEIKCVDPYFHKMADDQTNFYGVQPNFEFPFSVEFDWNGNVIWEQKESYRDVDLYDAAFGKDRFVGVGYGERTSMSYSFDAINWIDIDFLTSKTSSWPAVVYGDEKFVALFSHSNIGAYSLDGEKWELCKLPFEAEWNLLVYGNDIFIAIPKNGNRIAYSYDGIQWASAVFNLEIDLSRSKIIFGNDVFLLLQRDSDLAYYSSNGFDWMKLRFLSEAPWHDVAYGNGVFIFARSIPGNWAMTSDLSNWTYVDQPSEFYPFMLSYGDDRFYAINDYGDQALCSVDGINWLKSTLPVPVDWTHILSGNNIVAILSDGIFSAIATPGYDYIDPIEFSVYTIDNRMVIDYRGEIDTGIQITIECYEPPGDIIIYHVETLEHIQIFSDRIETVTGAPLGPKDIIEINTETGNKYVRLLRNGIYYNILGAMSRDMKWFTLSQGPNTYTYTTTDEHAAINMTFSYRDAYAAI